MPEEALEEAQAHLHPSSRGDGELPVQHSHEHGRRHQEGDGDDEESAGYSCSRGADGSDDHGRWGRSYIVQRSSEIGCSSAHRLFEICRLAVFASLVWLGLTETVRLLHRSLWL